MKARRRAYIMDVRRGKEDGAREKLIRRTLPLLLVLLCLALVACADACLGLYDKYYELYVKAGQVEG